VIDLRAGPAGRLLRTLRSANERAPIVVKLAVPLFVVLALMGIAGYTLVARPLLLAQLQEAYEDRALGLANAVHAEYAIDPGDRDGLGRFLRQVAVLDATVRRIRVYRVVSGSALVWASSEPADLTSYRPAPHDLVPLVTGATTHEIEMVDGEQVLETIRPLATQGGSDATIGIYSSLEPLERAMDAVTPRILAVLGVGVFLQAAAIFTVLEMVVLRPLRKLHHAALRVAAGDLTVRLGRVDPSPGRDEIAGVAREFDRMVVAVAQKDAEVRMLAVTDGLTGLLNRRAFDAQLGAEIDRAKRLGYALALSLIDLDGFKAVNDSLGHVVGDDALRRVARALTEVVRRTDIVARYGGDEFAVIHAGCDAAAAAAIGARARAAVQQIGIRARDGSLLSASAGIAEHAPTLAAEDLIATADAALYRAKARGGGVEVAVVTPRVG